MPWFLGRLSSQVSEQQVRTGQREESRSVRPRDAAFWGCDCSKDLLCPNKKALGASGSLERG